MANGGVIVPGGSLVPSSLEYEFRVEARQAGKAPAVASSFVTVQNGTVPIIAVSTNAPKNFDSKGTLVLSHDSRVLFTVSGSSSIHWTIDPPLPSSASSSSPNPTTLVLAPPPGRGIVLVPGVVYTVRAATIRYEHASAQGVASLQVAVNRSDHTWSYRCTHFHFVDQGVEFLQAAIIKENPLEAPDVCAYSTLLTRMSRRPPSGGTCTACRSVSGDGEEVCDATGAALVDEFVARCEGWADDGQAPLEYRFGFMRADGVTIDWLDKGIERSRSFRVPSGITTVAAAVLDGYGSSSDVVLMRITATMGARRAATGIGVVEAALSTARLEASLGNSAAVNQMSIAASLELDKLFPPSPSSSSPSSQSASLREGFITAVASTISSSILTVGYASEAGLATAAACSDPCSLTATSSLISASSSSSLALAPPPLPSSFAASVVAIESAGLASGLASACPNGAPLNTTQVGFAASHPPLFPLTKALVPVPFFTCMRASLYESLRFPSCLHASIHESVRFPSYLHEPICTEKCLRASANDM